MKTPSSVGLSDDVIDAENCLCVEYQRRDNIPEFEILTNDDSFWVPVAHRTHSRLKSPPESNQCHLTCFIITIPYFWVCCVY